MGGGRGKEAAGLTQAMWMGSVEWVVWVGLRLATARGNISRHESRFFIPGMDSGFLDLLLSCKPVS